MPYNADPPRPTTSSSSTRPSSFCEIYVRKFLSVFQHKPEPSLAPIEIPGLNGIMSNSGIAKVFDLDPRLSTGKKSRRKTLSPMPPASTNPLKRLFARTETEKEVDELLDRGRSNGNGSSEDNKLPKHSNIFTGMPTPTESAYPSRRQSPARIPVPKTKKGKHVTYLVTSNAEDDGNYGELAKMPSVNEPMPELYPGATMEEIEAYENTQKAAKEVGMDSPPSTLRHRNQNPKERPFLAQDGRRRSAPPSQGERCKENSPKHPSQQQNQAHRQHLHDQSQRHNSPISDLQPHHHRHRPLRRSEGSIVNKFTTISFESPMKPQQQKIQSLSNNPITNIGKSRQRPTSTSTFPLSTVGEDRKSQSPPHSTPRSQRTPPSQNNPRGPKLKNISKLSNQPYPKPLPQIPPSSTQPVHKSPEQQEYMNLGITYPSSPSSGASDIAPLHTLGALLEELDPSYFHSRPTTPEDSDTEEIATQKTPMLHLNSPGLAKNFLDMVKAVFSPSPVGGMTGLLTQLWCVLMGIWALFMVSRLLEGLIGLVDVLVVQPGRVFWGVVGKIIP